MAAVYLLKPVYSMVCQRIHGTRFGQYSTTNDRPTLMPPMIEVHHLRKEYGDTVALENLELEIPEGEVFGLIGPNGAGKTTLIRILATLLEPTYGSVRIAGIDV